MVGNINEIECRHIYEQVPIHIQNKVFVVDLNFLPISDANGVLGVQWFKSLGPIRTDYGTLKMKCVHHGKLIRHKGHCDGELNLISTHQVHCLLHTDNASAFFHIQALPIELPSDQTLQPLLQSILHKLHTLFQKPTTLPPD